VNAVCADTDEAAARLRSVAEATYERMRRGEVGHSATISVETGTSRDGLLSSAKSILGGESALANEVVADGGAGSRWHRRRRAT